MERPEPQAGTPELEPYEDGFVAWLGELGYSPGPARRRSPCSGTWHGGSRRSACRCPG